MYNNDSNSLDTGAPDIRITGNQNPNTQMASYGFDEAMAESRQAYDDARKKGIIPFNMEFEEFLELMREGGFLEGRAPQQNSGIMASAPKGTYTQNRKNQMMMAGGGVANLKNIKGQNHMLAYITPDEANSLQAMGGQKTMTPEGIGKR